MVADTLVEGAVSSSLDARNALWGTYWSDESTGITVYVDNAIDVRMARTTTKGASWSNTLLGTGGAMQIACWYDKENVGNTGTLVHVAWLDYDNQIVYYRTVDVATGSLGALRTVDSSVTVDFGSTANRIAITQTVSGNIIVAFSTQTKIECYKSSDGFATAGTDIADVFESGTQEDWCLLFPAATADGNDASALFWDRSTNVISIKMWDDSAGTWTETVVASSMSDDTSHINMDASVRHSDSRLLGTAHSNDDSSLDDIITFEVAVDSIASPTVTMKTNVKTDIPESAQVSIWINQQTDEVRIAYLKGGTWQSTVDVVYHTSTDGMVTWGTEQAYSESAADDFRLVHAGRTVGVAGGRYQPAFYDDDQTDIYNNENNDTEILPSSGVLEGAAALSGTGSIVASAVMTATASASLSGVGGLAAQATLGTLHSASAALSGVGGMSAAGVSILKGQAVLSGVGSLVAAGGRILSASAALAGIGDLASRGEIGGTHEGSASLSAEGILTASAVLILPSSAALSGAGNLVAVPHLTLGASVALSGEGTLVVLGETGEILYTTFGPILRDLDPADFPIGTKFYFEASFGLGGFSGTARVRLYNITLAAEVVDSPLSTSVFGVVTLRSPEITLASGPNTYRTEWGGAIGNTYSIFSADVVRESG